MQMRDRLREIVRKRSFERDCSREIIRERSFERERDRSRETTKK